MFAASKNGDILEINRLLDRGADINAKNNNNEWTALMFASIRSNDTSSLETVKLLLNRGADINAKANNGETALIVASLQANNASSIETVKLLLNRGADINAKTNNGDTALIFASLTSNDTSSLETVKLLLNRGADINAKTNNGETALMIGSVYSNDTSSLDTVELLLDRGADINAKTNDGDTALMAASKDSNDTSSLETVELLLNRGADPFVECPTDECKKIIAPYVWKRLYQRDLETSKRYSKSGDIILPKDIWELIMLNKRQQMLCQKLSSDKNKYVLASFALEMNIPITDNMTKAQLCGIISRHLAYGKYYKENTKRKIKEDMIQIKAVAFRYGIDVNRPIEEITKDLASIFTNIEILK